MANIDLNPGTPGNSTGLHVHVPAGQTASVVNNPSDFPSLPAKIGGKTVSVAIAPATGGPRFCNPS
jgi:hypothetical protein